MREYETGKELLLLQLALQEDAGDVDKGFGLTAGATDHTASATESDDLSKCRDECDVVVDTESLLS